MYCACASSKGQTERPFPSKGNALQFKDLTRAQVVMQRSYCRVRRRRLQRVKGPSSIGRVTLPCDG